MVAALNGADVWPTSPIHSTLGGAAQVSRRAGDDGDKDRIGRRAGDRATRPPRAKRAATPRRFLATHTRGSATPQISGSRCQSDNPGPYSWRTQAFARSPTGIPPVNKPYGLETKSHLQGPVTLIGSVP
jgi:hypothetical protein